MTGVEPAYPALWGQCVSSSTPHRSRDGRIRTHDFLVPGQALYQTEPRPDIMEHMGIEPIWISCVQNRRPPLAVPHPIFFLVPKEGFEPSKSAPLTQRVFHSTTSAYRTLCWCAKYREWGSNPRLLACKASTRPGWVIPAYKCIQRESNPHSEEVDFESTASA